MKTITLKADNGKFLVAELGGGVDARSPGAPVAVRADRDTAGEWEHWKVEDLADGWVALKTSRGFYLTAENGGGGALSTDRTIAGIWERFHLVRDGQKVGLQTHDTQHWVSAEVTSAQPVVNATRTSQGPWEWFTVEGLAAPAAVAPALHREGRTLRREDSSVWPWRMTTDFALLKRLMDGDDLAPIYAQRLAAGANGVRVFGAKAPSDNPQFPSLFALDPRDPTMYDATDRLFSQLGAAGLHCEFVVFVDEQTFGRSLDQQRAHANRMFEIMRGHPHVIGELVNEYPKNGITPTDFAQPAGILCSRGSGLSSGDAQGEPATPAWTHTTYHTERGPEWPRKFKSAAELQDKYDRACLANEPIRCDDGDGTTVEDWFDAGALAQLFTPGATFHTDKGRRSEIWTPYEEARATAFFAGMTAVPLEAHARGVYAKAIPNGIGLKDYDELRTYGAVIGGVTGNEQWAVVLRPGPAYPRAGARIHPDTVSGWSIAEQRGDRGTILKLTR